MESAFIRGNENPCPKATIAKVVAAHIEDRFSHKTAGSVKLDISYLRRAFGPICPALEVKNAKTSEKRKILSKKKLDYCFILDYK